MPVFQLVADLLNFLFQHGDVQFVFADDGGFAAFGRGLYLFHSAVFPNQIVHMCLAHAAHHTVNA